MKNEVELIERADGNRAEKVEVDMTVIRPLGENEVKEAVALLQSWFAEDPQEQRDTWEYLKTALDEDRLSDRKLFDEHNYPA